ALVEDYDHAIRTWQAGRDGQTSARANIEDALDQGFDIARTLDIFVASQLGDDSGAIAVWERGRRCDVPRVSRGTRKATGATPPSAQGTAAALNTIELPAHPESPLPNPDTGTANDEPLKEAA